MRKEVKIVAIALTIILILVFVIPLVIILSTLKLENSIEIGKNQELSFSTKYKSLEKITYGLKINGNLTYSVKVDFAGLSHSFKLSEGVLSYSSELKTSVNKFTEYALEFSSGGIANFLSYVMGNIEHSLKQDAGGIEYTATINL